MGDLEVVIHGQLCALYKNNTVKLNLASNFKLFNFSGPKRSGLTEKTLVTRTARRRDTLRREHEVHIHVGQEYNVTLTSLMNLENTSQILYRYLGVRGGVGWESGTHENSSTCFEVSRVESPNSGRIKSFFLHLDITSNLFIYLFVCLFVCNYANIE